MIVSYGGAQVNFVMTFFQRSICKQSREPVTVDNIMEGEAIPPDTVKTFFKMLYTENVLTTEELSSKKFRLTVLLTC